MNSVVVIGVGNPDRGDDAAGREVVRRLASGAAEHIRLIEADGEASSLLAYLEGASTAFLVDACVSGAPAGTVRRIDLATESLPRARYGLSSHGLGLAEALELAQALGQLPSTCVIYAIEAERVDFGAPLSAAAARGVAETVAALRREIAAL
jgi:hydrogenase maturation protease